MRPRWPRSQATPPGYFPKPFSRAVNPGPPLEPQMVPTWDRGRPARMRPGWPRSQATPQAILPQAILQGNSPGQLPPPWERGRLARMRLLYAGETPALPGCLPGQCSRVSQTIDSLTPFCPSPGAAQHPIFSHSAQSSFNRVVVYIVDHAVIMLLVTN